MTELSLWLDYYDDIYSDFDSRHYGKRRISEDFLYELKTALQYKQERAGDLVLLMPEDKRDKVIEPVIVKGLKDFFTMQLNIQRDKYRRKFNNGLLLGIIGIFLMLFNSFIAFKGVHSFSLVALRVILEPAGWFLLWVSLDFLFYDQKDLKKEIAFFKEMAAMKIHFKTA